MTEYLLTPGEIRKIEGQVFAESQPLGMGFDMKVNQAISKAQSQKTAKAIIEIVEDFFGMPKSMFEEKYTDFKFDQQKGWALSLIDYLKKRFEVK